MRTLNRLFCSTLFCATVLTAQTVWATTYYVDRNLPGNDGNAGTTETTAFLTIAKCVAVAINPGDTCLVKNGTYPEPWRMTRSGTAGNPITISNFPGHKPLIRMSERTIATNRILLASTISYTTPIGWIVIKGLEITNGYSGLNITNGHDIIMQGNNIHDMYMGAFGGNGTRLTIDRNRMHHNGRFAECSATQSICNKDQAVYLSGSYINIMNNVIYNNLSYGIQVAGSAYDSTKYAGPEYAGATNWIIANNTIAYQAYRAGIVIWNAGGGASNNRVENNILYENSQVSGTNAGIDFQDAGGGNIIRNNLHYATSPGGTTFITGGIEGASYTQSGNIVNTSNPNFVNGPSSVPASPDFKLQSNSPAIDKGLIQSIVKEDFDGAPRPQGAAFDIGAFEFRVETGAVPPSAPSGLKIF